jgi:hypothetical protein
MKIYALLVLGAAGEAVAGATIPRADGKAAIRQYFRFRLAFTATIN